MGKEGAAQERNGVEAATRVSSTLRQPSTSGGMYAWMISIHEDERPISSTAFCFKDMSRLWVGKE